MEKPESSKKIVCFGASIVGRRFLQKLKASNHSIHCFYDNDINKWGGFIDNAPIYPPDKLKEENPDNTVVYIASLHYDAIKKQLAEYGFHDAIYINRYHAWQPNIKTLDINITYRCTLQCVGCHVGVTITAKNNPPPDLTLAQLEKMLDESERIQYPWETMQIIGGEPTIHPQFEQMVAIVAAYKKRCNPKLFVGVNSNGFSPLTHKKLEWLKKEYPEICVINSRKENSTQKHFVAVHKAPCDNTDATLYNYDNACPVAEICPLAFDYSGFYPCSAGAAIARIFRYDIGIKHLLDVCQESLAAMFQPLCSKCGHYKPTIVSLGDDTKNISPTWEKAIAAYHCAGDGLRKF